MVSEHTLGMHLQPSDKLPDRAKKLSSPEELRCQNRQTERNDEDGRDGSNNERHTEPEDAEADHGYHDLPRQAKPWACGIRKGKSLAVHRPPPFL